MKSMPSEEEDAAKVVAIVVDAVDVVAGVEVPIRAQDLQLPQDNQLPLVTRGPSIQTSLLGNGQGVSCISNTDEEHTSVQSQRHAHGKTFSLQGLQNEI